MQINTVVIIKHPWDRVWEAMQNHISQIAADVVEIESIQTQDKLVADTGDVRITNLWTARPPVPDFLKKVVQPAMFVWTDTAVWKPDSQSCHWVIHSHYFKEKMECSGQILFEPALGGKGCRLSFQGNIVLQPGAMGILQSGVEPVLSNLIPANFRQLAQAAERFLNRPEGS